MHMKAVGPCVGMSDSRGRRSRSNLPEKLASTFAVIWHLLGYDVLSIVFCYWSAVLFVSGKKRQNDKRQSREQHAVKKKRPLLEILRICRFEAKFWIVCEIR